MNDRRTRELRGSTRLAGLLRCSVRRGVDWRRRRWRHRLSHEILREGIDGRHATHLLVLQRHVDDVEVVVEALDLVDVFALHPTTGEALATRAAITLTLFGVQNLVHNDAEKRESSQQRAKGVS